MQNILKQNVIGIDVAKRKLDIYDQKSNRYWVVENTAKGKNPMKMQKSLGRSLIAEIKLPNRSLRRKIAWSMLARSRYVN